jgi:hypothetical protein
MEEKINMVSLKFIFGLLIFILLLHVIAIVNSWYWVYTWLDIPMHFLGGFWLAVVFFYFVNPRLQIINYKLLITLISALGFVALVGVFWEFFEFLCDVFIFSKGYLEVAQQGTADTMSDLFFDLLGGLAFLIICKYFLKNNDAKIQENKDYFPE